MSLKYEEIHHKLVKPVRMYRKTRDVKISFQIEADHIKPENSFKQVDYIYSIAKICFKSNGYYIEGEPLRKQSTALMNGSRGLVLLGCSL